LDQRATLDWTAARQEIPAVSCVLADTGRDLPLGGGTGVVAAVAARCPGDRVAIGANAQWH